MNPSIHGQLVSHFIGPFPRPRQVQIAPETAAAQLPIDPVKPTRPEPAPAPIRTCLALSDAICPDLNFPGGFWCLRTQADWINDQWHLRAHVTL